MFALVIAASLVHALPPLPRDPASVTANDLFSFNKPPADRTKAPPAPTPLVVVVSPGATAWPMFEDESRLVRDAVRARIDKEGLPLRTVDWSDVYRDRAVHPKTGAQCAGRYAAPLPAYAPAWAYASADVTCATTKLGDPVQHCDVNIVVRGPYGLTSTPFTEILRLHAKLPAAVDAGDARAAEVVRRAVQASVKVTPHEVDPKQGGLLGSLGRAEKDDVPHRQTKLLQARVFRGVDREGAVAPDGARLKLYNKLLACSAEEGVTSSTTATFRAARDTAYRCDDGSSNKADDVSQCICTTIAPYVAQQERWSFQVRRPTSAGAAKLRAFFLPDVISSTEERFTGNEVSDAAVFACLAPMKPTTHLWRRQRVTIDAVGNVVALEAEGSPLPADVAACWDAAMRATKLGCPVDPKGATIDVVYHLFPWGSRPAGKL